MVHKIRTNKQKRKNDNKLKTKKVSRKRRQRSNKNNKLIKKGGVILFISHVDNPFEEYKLTDNDKNKPLSDFFIYSSHNTEVETKQYHGQTGNTYVKCGFLENNSVLQKGGCLELDIQGVKKQDTNNYEYYVGHMAQKGTKMPLSNVFAEISTYSGESPLIVNMDTTQLIRSKIITDGFKSVLTSSGLYNKLCPDFLYKSGNPETLKPYLNEIQTGNNVLIRWDYDSGTKSLKTPPSSKRVSPSSSPRSSPRTSRSVSPVMFNSRPSTPTSPTPSDILENNGHTFNEFTTSFIPIELQNSTNSYTGTSVENHSSSNENKPLIHIVKKECSKTFKHDKDINNIFKFRKDNPLNLIRTFPSGGKSYNWGDLLLTGCNLISINFQNYDIDNLAYQSFFLPSHYIPIPETLKTTSSENFELHKENIIIKSYNNVKIFAISEGNKGYTIQNYFFKNSAACPYFKDDLSILNLFIITNNEYYGIVNLSNIDKIKMAHQNKYQIRSVKLYIKNKTKYINLKDSCELDTNNTKIINVTLEFIDFSPISVSATTHTTTTPNTHRVVAVPRISPSSPFLTQSTLV